MTGRLPGGPLRILLAGWFLVGAGSWAFSVALAVYAFDVAGPGWVAVVTATRMFPAMLAAPVMGRFLDRGDRARIAGVAATIQAASVAGTAALMLAEAPLLPIIVLAGAASVAATAQRPALEALMPALASTPEDLIRATALWSALDNGGFLLGSGVGGIAIAATGTGPVVAAGAVCLLASALLVTGLPSTRAEAADEPEDEEESLLAETLGGLRAVVQSRELRVPFALLAALVALDGSTEVQLVVLAIDDLGMGDGGPGALYLAWGVGGIAGSFLLLTLLRRRGYGLALGVGAIVLGLTLALTGIDGVALALAVMVPAGAGFALVETGVMAVVPRLADDVVVGRVYALFEVMYAAATGLGALLAAPLIAWLGAGGSLAACGGAYALMGLLSWPALSRLDFGQEDAGRVRELLRALPFMSPLPLPRLERLVRGARCVEVPAGDVIIALGDHGEEYFVIEEGTVDVLEYGRSMGAGEGFGEIALLKDVPRTATVQAATDVRLRALSRPAFLAAVTGHGEASALADAIAAEHLARERVLP